MDEFDRATEAEMRDRDMAIEAASRKKRGPEATGECLWCGDAIERLGEGLRWCCVECRNDWAEHDRMWKIGGRR